MKLVYFDDFKLGVLNGDSVVDVSAVVRDIPNIDPGSLMNGLIERFDDYRGRLENAATAGIGVSLSDVRIRPPVPGPTTIDCMAVNYMEDGTRDAPAPINAFHKSPGAIIGNGDTMVLPDVPASIFEGEAEVAIVIGKTNTPAEGHKGDTSNLLGPPCRNPWCLALSPGEHDRLQASFLAGLRCSHRWRCVPARRGDRDAADAPADGTPSGPDIGASGAHRGGQPRRPGARLGHQGQR